MISVDISTRCNPGCILMVDEEDAHLLQNAKWTPDRRGHLIYAHRRAGGRASGKKIYVHREILQAPAGKIVDHIDRNGLNNTRANLRIVTDAESNWNRRGYGASIFRGVFRKRAKWGAAIKVNGEKLWLGSHATEREAAMAFDAAAIAAGMTAFGLNFPERKQGDA